MKVVSFNIKCDDTIAQLAEEQLWTNRKENLIKEINLLDADIMGMQEVMSHQYSYFKQNLPKYNSIYQSRDENAVNGEGSPIFYKKEKFECLQSGTFWLSETPNVHASTSWNSRWPRICTFVVLKDNQTGKIFAHFNAHLDHKSEEARTNGMKLIVSKLKETKLPAVLTGDFNSPANGGAVLECEAKLTNANINNDKSITFHLWGNPEALPEAIRKLDYIYVDNIKVNSYKVVNDVENATKNSDHYALEAELEL